MRKELSFNCFIQERMKLALIQEDKLDNTLTSTVKIIGEGFQLEIKKGEIINLKLKVN